MSRIRDNILALLSDQPEITVSEIARRLGLSRTTVIKYLKVMIKEGLVSYRKVGPAKLVFLKDEGKREARRSIAEKERHKIRNALKSFLDEGFALEIFNEDEIKVLKRARRILSERKGE